MALKTTIKLSAWAKSRGIAYVTAYRWFHAGRLPVPAEQMASGAILVDVSGEMGGAGALAAPAGGAVALYARVSGADQRGDVERQLGRLVTAAAARGWTVAHAVSEVGSGLSVRRPKLQRLLRDPAVQIIVVEHRDRLARFGVELVEATLAASGRQLVVLEDAEVADDLVRDVTEVLTRLCARLYGRRRAARRAKAAVAAAVAPDVGAGAH